MYSLTLYIRKEMRKETGSEQVIKSLFVSDMKTWNQVDFFLKSTDVTTFA